MTSTALRSALDNLAQVADAAGLDPDQARCEGMQLAAAISEPANGAYVDWSEQVGRDPDARQFFESASRGRRWRVSPTPLMSQLGNTHAKQAEAYAEALGQIATAACTLGQPSPRSAGLAAAAAAAQLQAVPGRSAAPATPASPPDLRTLDDVPGNAPGLNPALLAGLQESQERLAAMDRFSQFGNEAFQSVLDQLQANQQRIAELRGQTMVGLPGQSPARPDQPAQPGAPAAPGAPGQVTADPASPAATAEAEPERSVAELIGELDALIGLEKVKAEIKRQAAILRVQALRHDAGLKVPTITRHLVFVGNPGTGKTTVARLVAGIYKALGLLSRGQLVEVDRSELVAGYLGQTALKTAEVAGSAKGGVLFIDEAYSLSGDQYGEEAINTLVKEMEDNRDDLVVIVAGYPEPMSVFIAENPGLASRFRTTIEFENYTDEQLVEIFCLQARNADYELADGTLDAFKFDLSHQARDDTFGNGRYCRNMLEAAVGQQAWRLRDAQQPTVEQLRTLLPADILGDRVMNPGDELVPVAPGGTAGCDPATPGSGPADRPAPDGGAANPGAGRLRELPNPVPRSVGESES